MHARDAAPDAGLAGCGPIDDSDAADALAPQAVSDREAALAAADDDDVVVDAGARPNPINEIAPDPAQGVLDLLFEVLSRVGELQCRALRLSAERNDLGRGAEATDGQCGRAAKESAPVDPARRRFF